MMGCKLEKEVILNYFKIFVKCMNHINLSKEEKSTVRKVDKLWKGNNLRMKIAINNRDSFYSMVFSNNEKKELVSIQGSMSSNGNIEYDYYTYDSMVFEMGII